VLRDHVRKDGFNPNVVGGNRDVLDFAMQGALKDNLTGNGLQNDWRNVVNAGLDTYDDGLHNGSMGVLFVGSHDDGTGPHTTDTALLEREGHMGLTGMRERIAALGGSVRFDGQPGAGARVEVQVPITAGEAA